jgi:uridine kinase
MPPVKLRWVTTNLVGKISPIVVGIAGGTASGKSTLAQRLSLYYGDRCLLLSHDRYYLDVDDPSIHNYDHPESLETSLCAEHVRVLSSGGAVELPIYDFSTHSRMKSVDPVNPPEILIVEGILVLSEPELRALFDLSVFIYADQEVRLERRIARDLEERGRDRAGVLAQFESTVRPMHDQFVEPSRRHASIQISGEGSIEDALDTLISAIELRTPLTLSSRAL